MKKISANELNQKISAKEDLFLLDIRENYEREIGAIPSVHVPMGEIPEKANELPKNKEIVVICRSGRRAEPVAYLLETDFAFPNVSILDGGLTAWQEQIDPNLILE